MLQMDVGLTRLTWDADDCYSPLPELNLQKGEAENRDPTSKESRKEGTGKALDCAIGAPTKDDYRYLL